MRGIWVFDPHSGGVKIEKYKKSGIERRASEYAEKYLKNKCNRIELRFRGALCYVAASKTEDDGREYNIPLCRLRHFDENKWSIALFTWSNEKYEPCIFPNGAWFGNLEECLELGSVFL